MPKLNNYIQEENETVINRYPVMAVLSYCIAKRRGYNENVSKALGIGVATGYAILKNVGTSFVTPFSYKSKDRQAGKITLEDKLLDEDIIADCIGHCGIEFLKRPGSDSLEGIRRIRGRQYPFTSDDFDRKVVAKLNALKKNGFQFLCGEINRDLKEINILETPKPLKFYEFWKNHRDGWRSKKLWEKE